MSMSESFAELFEESLKSVDMKPGTIVTGVVIDLDKDWVTVHAGLKSEGIIPVNQFLNEQGELDIQIGDEVQVALESVEDGFGETRLSREKAKRAEAWKVLEAAHSADEVIRSEEHTSELQSRGHLVFCHLLTTDRPSSPYTTLFRSRALFRSTSS